MLISLLNLNFDLFAYSYQFLAKSDFVIKVDGLPSEQYWLSLLRAWLISLQVHLDNALKKGEIDKLTGNIINSSDTSVEVNIARLLTCSVGRVFNCSDRVSNFSTH